MVHGAWPTWFWRILQFSPLFSSLVLLSLSAASACDEGDEGRAVINHAHCDGVVILFTDDYEGMRENDMEVLLINLPDEVQEEGITYFFLRLSTAAAAATSSEPTSSSSPTTSD